ncbi:MAG: DUF2087 domain-containing protein [Acholeplasmataceae bacterium]|jgi:hypothetical protein|nr:DUF2087 domain-containing protein [Acholeplasmataceae bacterium]
MYNIKKEEIKKIYDTHLISKKPLRLKQFPSREKKKFIILGLLVHYFKPGKLYKESEINDILKEIHDDYAVLRRYLVDYKFLRRELDGSIYELIADPNDYNMYKIEGFLD